MMYPKTQMTAMIMIPVSMSIHYFAVNVNLFPIPRFVKHEYTHVPIEFQSQFVGW